MQIIIDSNILFSALIKDSLTRKIILTYEGSFLFPSFIFEEMEGHKQELLDKSGMNRGEFDKLLGIILKKVAIIPCEVLFQFKENERKVLKVFLGCTSTYRS